MSTSTFLQSLQGEILSLVFAREIQPATTREEPSDPEEPLVFLESQNNPNFQTTKKKATDEMSVYSPTSLSVATQAEHRPINPSRPAEEARILELRDTAPRSAARQQESLRRPSPSGQPRARRNGVGGAGGGTENPISK